jgi:ABC-type multidrug transport system ATPase subunit
MATQPASGQAQIHVPNGDFAWVIGSDPTLAKDSAKGLHCPLPGIDPKHARFTRSGNRCFLEDLNSKTGVSLNGVRIPAGVRIEVSRYDDIKLGPQPFNIHPQVFFGGGLAGLDCTELRFDVGGKKGVLCEGVFIRAKPGTITAVMGPSGAGKSVFLNLLNGYNKPTNGHVFVGGLFDVHGAGGAKAVRDFVGYVPQAEVMIPELTVLESLYYRLRLRYPDIKRDFCERFARQVCSRLGFAGDELTEFLNKRIGSPESRGRVLSGGQRRRANIAHELVCRTQVLILDEPTSGLSSVDADQIVALLHDLAKQDGLTVITTVHQPSRDSFSKFDDLLLMSYGGKVAYYGSAQQAPMILEKATGKTCGAKNPAEYVLEALKVSGDRDKLTKQFSNPATRPPVTPSPFSGAGQKVTSPAATKSGEKGSIWRRFQTGLITPFAWGAECRTLIARNVRVLTSDWVHLLFIIGQVPLIALLMFLAFHKVQQDNAPYDAFARRFFFLGQALEPFDKDNKGGFVIDQAWRESAEQAKAATELISELAAKQRASVIFTLAVAAIWFGIMGSCKEIVSEQHIVQRESRSCIRLGPYVAAKMGVQLVLVAIQTGLLSAMVVPWMLGLSAFCTARMWLVLWIAGMAAAALGLLISGVARTYRVALTSVPLLMIPQLLFGGLLRPIASIQGVTWWPQLLSYITIQRWAFEAGLSVDKYAVQNVLRQYIDLNAAGRYAELKIIQFQNGTLLGAFFGEQSMLFHGVMPLVVLVSATAILLVLCWVVLRRRFVS